MSDTVLVAIVTASTGLLSGMLGYASARAQLGLEAARLEREGQTEAEAKLAAAVAARQTLYIEYLNTLDRWHGLVANFEIDEWNEWSEEYQRVDNRVELLGSDDVRESTYPLHRAMTAMGDATVQARRTAEEQEDFAGLEESKQDVRIADAVREVLPEHLPPILAARANVLAAMREDLGRSRGDKPSGEVAPAAPAPAPPEATRRSADR